MVMSRVKTIIDAWELTVKQGLDMENYVLRYLLSCLSNIVAATNTPSTTSSIASSDLRTTYSHFIPEISTSSISTATTTTTTSEEHRKDLISSVSTLNKVVLAIALTTQVQGEEAVHFELPNVDAFGQRLLLAKITTTFLNGLSQFQLPADLSDYITLDTGAAVAGRKRRRRALAATDEAFLLLFSGVNMLDWGLVGGDSTRVNTQVGSMSMLQTNRQKYDVNNLPETSQIKMYLMAQDASSNSSVDLPDPNVKVSTSIKLQAFQRP
jgi:hypothetical protein